MQEEGRPSYALLLVNTEPTMRAVKHDISFVYANRTKQSNTIIGSAALLYIFVKDSSYQHKTNILNMVYIYLKHLTFSLSIATQQRPRIFVGKRRIESILYIWCNRPLFALNARGYWRHTRHWRVPDTSLHQEKPSSHPEHASNNRVWWLYIENRPRATQYRIKSTTDRTCTRACFQSPLAAMKCFWGKSSH